MRRQPIFVPPPVESMDGLWTEAERYMVESRMALAVVGDLKEVQQQATAHIAGNRGR